MRPLYVQERHWREGTSYITNFHFFLLLGNISSVQYRKYSTDYSSSCTQGLSSVDLCCKFKYGWSVGFQMKFPAPVLMETVVERHWLFLVCSVPTGSSLWPFSSEFSFYLDLCPDTILQEWNSKRQGGEKLLISTLLYSHAPWRKQIKKGEFCSTEIFHFNETQRVDLYFSIEGFTKVGEIIC